MKVCLFLAGLFSASQAFTAKSSVKSLTQLRATQEEVGLAPPGTAPPAAPLAPPPPPPPAQPFADRLDEQMMDNRYPNYSNIPTRDWRYRAWSPPLLQGGNEDRYGVPPMSMTNQQPTGWKWRAWSPPLLTGGNEDRYGVEPMSITTTPPTGWKWRAWSPPLSQGGNDPLPNRWNREF